MTAKEFLRRARDANRRAEKALERLDRLRAKLEAGRMSSASGMPRGGSSDWTETADRLIELERSTSAQVRELMRWKEAALAAIRAVPDPRQAEALELYYIGGLTWEQVARQMHTTSRWVMILHGRGLQRVKVPEDFSGG